MAEEARSDPVDGVSAAAVAMESDIPDTEKPKNPASGGSESGIDTTDQKMVKKEEEEGGGGGGGDGEDEDGKYGFTRAEMYRLGLAGSVGLYERHLFLCYKDARSWPHHVEAADFDRLPRHLVAALRARKNDMPKTKFTICERRDESGSSSGDVLIFPEMLKFGNLTHLDVDSFVEEVLVKGKDWIAGRSERLTGSHIFVCCHASRDARCGYCGPLLIEKFNEEITNRSLNDQVFVRACSHVGGHKYAGNIIVYSPQSKGGAITGHWYGYVTPQDVADILEQHIGKGEIVERLWRGQMGMDEEEQKLSQNGRLQSGRCEGCTCVQSQPCSAPVVSQSIPLVEDKSREFSVITDIKKGEQNGEESTKDKEQNGEESTKDKEQNGEEPTKDKEVTKTIPKAKSSGSRGICHFNFASRLFETWEMEDTLVAAALIGAAVSVTLAFHFYRKSS